MADRLRVLALYPELMSIYADRGNLAVLHRRCEWRGIGFTIADATLGDPIEPGEHDLLYLGGGQDRDQKLVAEDLVTEKREAIAACVADGAVLLGICGGLQLLGTSYQLGEESIPGLGMVDLHTVRSDGPRLIGDVAIELPGGEVLAGFENHGGRTHLGDGEQPLGRVLSGHGNNGTDGGEGVRRDRVLGTYLHGPLLPKNAWFADELIALALGRDRAELAPLPDALEAAAHAEARRAAG